MIEYVDYQLYEKCLLLTLSIDFNKEGGIYLEVQFR